MADAHSHMHSHGSSSNSSTQQAAPPSSFHSCTELGRERESYKYYNLQHIPLFEHYAGLPQLHARRPADAALTSFAQLVAIHLNTKRALISLFDQNYQYIIAESTQSSKLRANNANHDVWLGGLAIPRSYGICESVLAEPAKNTDSDLEKLMERVVISVVPNLADDERFRERNFVCGEPYHRFYAGVPIITPAGTNIGVLCVFDDKPRNTIDDVAAEFLKDMATTIMEHLELCRHRTLHRRTERMVRGLGSFVEAKSTIGGWHKESNALYSERIAGEEGTLNVQQQQIYNDARNLESDTSPTHASSQPPTQPAAMSLDGCETSSSLNTAKSKVKPAEDSSGQHRRSPLSKLQGPSEVPKENDSQILPASPHARSLSSDSAKSKEYMPTESATLQSAGVPDPHVLEINTLFSRAANILRESIEVEGVIFFDANVATSGGLDWEVDDHSSDSTESNTHSLAASEGAPCNILGFSTSDFSSINGEFLLRGNFCLRERQMKNLLRHHSSGKIWNYDTNGMRTSDSDELPFVPKVHASGQSVSGRVRSGKRKRVSRPVSRDRSSRMMAELFPGARSVVVVPLWDPHKNRWFAGVVAWSYRADRYFTAEDDLSYLMAFGTTIMGEVARLDAIRADRAKSDVLGSISHELRSPLHGILGGVDMLYSTNIDTHQGDIVNSMETCSVTLLDSINHLLEHARINNLKQIAKSGVIHERRRTSDQPVSLDRRPINPEIEMDALVEEVLETVFVGHIFQASNLRRQGLKKAGTPFEDYRNDMEPNYAKSASPAGQASAPISRRLSAADLQIIFDADASLEWKFHADPGGIRRVLMNLLANSLKFTSKGSITVSLRQVRNPASIFESNQFNITIQVVDTGLGIGKEFLRNLAFTPFAQEDDLTPGVGLGLSITRKIVSSLQGTISIESEVGTGTVVTVMLPMTKADSSVVENNRNDMAEKTEFQQAQTQLAGIRVKLFGFHDESVGWSGDKFSDWQLPRNLVRSVCQTWLGMEVLQDEEDSTIIPDLYLSTELGAQELARFNQRASIQQPIITICRNALMARSLALELNLTNSAGIFEFTSQPCGPRKMAKALIKSVDRWTEFQIAAPSGIEFGAGSFAEHVDAATGTWESNNLTTSQMTTPLDQPGIPRSDQLIEFPNSSSPSKLDIPSTTSTAGERSPPFLLVDDNQINLQLLSAYLRKKKCQYTIATNGQEALEAYKAANPKYKCIFMDLSMPVMDGLEATRRIRSLEQARNLEPTSIIALTGLASAETQREAFASGVDLFMTKPVRLREIDRFLAASRLSSPFPGPVNIDSPPLHDLTKPYETSQPRP